MISADCRMGGFHENRLIRCVREREKEIRTKHVVADVGGKTPSQDMKASSDRLSGIEGQKGERLMRSPVSGGSMVSNTVLH